MKELRVCVGTSCHLNGANNIIMTFRHLIEEYGLYDQLDLSAMFCPNTCAQQTVAVHLGDETYRLRADEARQFFLQTVLPQCQK